MQLHLSTVAVRRAYPAIVKQIASRSAHDPWASMRDQMRERGMRWTPQRRLVLNVLSEAQGGHVTAAELLDRCRAADPQTTPSTVYRTLDVLEELGLVRHAHGVDGREEFHVLPERDHGHLTCSTCGTSWEIDEDEAAAFVGALAYKRGFTVDLSHLGVVGTCAACKRQKH
jgi:Fur family ferric uptake transcriptional regulator